jgi:hypothetical protein
MKKFQFGNKMASTRKRTTTKTGNFTKRTVTVSKSGTRVTNSFRPPGGATRRTHSVNLRTGQNRTTHTTHHGGGWSTTRSSTKTLVRKARPVGSSKSRNSNGDDDLFVLLIVSFFAWIYEILFGSKEEKVEEPNLSENEERLISYMQTLTDDQSKILIYDTLGVWINANNITEDIKEKIRNFDWINFNFEEWKIENGFEQSK